jgi:hypothetical protein
MFSGAQIERINADKTANELVGLLGTDNTDAFNESKRDEWRTIYLLTTTPTTTATRPCFPANNPYPKYYSGLLLQLLLY